MESYNYAEEWKETNKNLNVAVVFLAISFLIIIAWFIVFPPSILTLDLILFTVGFGLLLVYLSLLYNV